jgi:hypothetical protein
VRIACISSAFVGSVLVVTKGNPSDMSSSWFNIAGAGGGCIIDDIEGSYAVAGEASVMRAQPVLILMRKTDSVGAQ